MATFDVRCLLAVKLLFEDACDFHLGPVDRLLCLTLDKQEELLVPLLDLGSWREVRSTRCDGCTGAL